MNDTERKFRASLEVAAKKYPEMKDKMNKEHKQALEKSDIELVKNSGREPGE